MRRRGNATSSWDKNRALRKTQLRRTETGRTSLLDGCGFHRQKIKGGQQEVKDRTPNLGDIKRPEVYAAPSFRESSGQKAKMEDNGKINIRTYKIKTKNRWSDKCREK